MVPSATYLAVCYCCVFFSDIQYASSVLVYDRQTLFDIQNSVKEMIRSKRIKHLSSSVCVLYTGKLTQAILCLSRKKTTP